MSPSMTDPDDNSSLHWDVVSFFLVLVSAALSCPQSPKHRADQPISSLFSHPVMSDSLRPHGLQHARPPCPSPSPGVCPSSCPLHQWYHPAISSSVTLFFCLQSFPASGSLPMSQLIASGDQSIWASASILPISIQGWFPLLPMQQDSGWTLPVFPFFFCHVASWETKSKGSAKEGRDLDKWGSRLSHWGHGTNSV